jgi:hypothetical protein
MELASPKTLTPIIPDPKIKNSPKEGPVEKLIKAFTVGTGITRLRQK